MYRIENTELQLTASKNKSIPDERFTFGLVDRGADRLVDGLVLRLVDRLTGLPGQRERY